MLTRTLNIKLSEKKSQFTHRMTILHNNSYHERSRTTFPSKNLLLLGTDNRNIGVGSVRRVSSISSWYYVAERPSIQRFRQIIRNTGHRKKAHFTHVSSISVRPTCRRSHPLRRRSGQGRRTDRCHRRTRRHDKWAGLPGWPRPGATAQAVQIPCCRVSLKTRKQVLNIYTH